MVKYGLQWILCVNTRIRRRAYSRRRRKAASRPVSRVLYGGETARQPFIWDHRCRRPRATNPDGSVETRLRAKPCAIPIRSCSRWGLPCHDRYRPRGALLPHPFTLTGTNPGGLLSVALSLGSPPPGVTRHRVSMEPGLSSAQSTAAARSTGRAQHRRGKPDSQQAMFGRIKRGPAKRCRRRSRQWKDRSQPAPAWSRRSPGCDCASAG